MQKFIPKLLSKIKRPAFYTTILLIALFLLSPFITYFIVAADIKDKQSIINHPNTGLTLLDRDGKIFFTFYNPKDIEYIPFSDIPTSAQEAVIASEDKDFYTNPGFSFRGIIRAVFANMIAGKIVQGGSTITQELVKNQFLDAKRNFLRKYQEIVIASEINRRYSKQDILEMYLNSVYFGEGAFGIENAASKYFGIHAKNLSLAQSALLIGLLPAPSSLSPLSNDPSIALAHQKLVLTEMVKDNYITQAEADTASKETMSFHPEKDQVNTLAPHFALYVKDQLIKKYGEENVIRRGMTVRTTLNSEFQSYAEHIVASQVYRLSTNNTSNGAAIIMDPQTGEILAMVGSSNWQNETFGKTNMALAPRQPGSSFKPIIYANAFERSLITPATILHDTKTTFPDNYTPHDYDNKTRGNVTARRALANSLNIPSVEVMQKVGISDALSMAQRLGITSLGNDTSQYGLSLVLGSGEVSLLQMTSAYAVFADKGVYNPPLSILEVKDKYGKTIDSFQNQSQNVLGQDVSFLISSILSDNNTRAEVFGNALTISRPAAAKTGTTENYRDALTLGYTPSLVIGVWIGNNDNTPMDNVAGSLGAAPIWRQLMEHALIGVPIENFTPPSNIITQRICPYQGTTNQKQSTQTITEYFIQGTQPAEPCIPPSPTPTGSPPPTDQQFEIPTPNDYFDNQQEYFPWFQRRRQNQFPTPTEVPEEDFFTNPQPTLPVIPPTQQPTPIQSPTPSNFEY